MTVELQQWRQATVVEPRLTAVATGALDGSNKVGYGRAMGMRPPFMEWAQRPPGLVKTSPSWLLFLFISPLLFSLRKWPLLDPKFLSSPTLTTPNSDCGLHQMGSQLVPQKGEQYSTDMMKVGPMMRQQECEESMQHQWGRFAGTVVCTVMIHVAWTHKIGLEWGGKGKKGAPLFLLLPCKNIPLNKGTLEEEQVVEEHQEGVSTTHDTQAKHLY